MRSITATLIALIVVLAVPITSAAQSEPAGPSMSVPRLVHIAGVFQPVDRQPPAGVEVVTLSIYEDAHGGLPVWQERQSVTVDKSGRFTLLLGASYPDGIPADVFGSGQAQWMGLLFERVGEGEQPRVRIASVPYSLKAADAETLGGLPASAYLRTPTAEPIAVVGRETSLAVPATDPPITADVLPGTTNFLAKYVNGVDVGNSGVYEAPTVLVPSGAVGIGTTTPADVLHLQFTNTAGQITGLAVQNLGNTTASYSGMLFYDQFGALGQFQGFNNVTHEYRINNIASSGSINFMIGSTSRFFIASNGNIGVGVAVPIAKVDVAGNINTTTQYNIGGSQVLSVAGLNTFAGLNAGLLNTGSNNSFFGRIAGRLNTGNDNAFFGDGVGQSNTGAENTFVGKDAGFNNTSGFRNAFLGRGAGYANQLGSDNSSVGFQAGANNTNSCCNVFFGSFSGNAAPAGSHNALIGYNTEFGAAALTNATAIGARAMVSQSNSLILGSIAGVNSAAADTRVGIGLVDPARKLHISGVGSDGTGVADLRITGTGQIASGITLESTGTGGRTYSWLSTADNSGSGGFGPGRLAAFDVAAGAYRMVIDENGQVGIGTYTPDRLLSVNGDASKVGGGSWDIFSDERLKNIKGRFTPGLEALMQLQPVRYEYKKDNALGLTSSREHIGFGAQAVQKIIPEAVSTNAKGYLLVNNDPIVWTMLNAIQEQQTEIQALQQRLASLEEILAGRR